MPKTPIDYSKSVIYKIEHLEKPELLYVGSTTDFIKRKARHKYNCNNSSYDNYNLKLYQMIRNNDGWESFKLMIIKEYPCNSKIELQIEEEEKRKELQAGLNSYRAFRTIEEKKEYEKSYMVKYNSIHKTKLKDYNVDYRTKNKDKIKENKNEKITCECGHIYTRNNKLRHKNSKKHCQFIKN